MVCDQIPDCMNGSDESPLVCNASNVQVLSHKSLWPCKEPTEIPCGMYSAKCYNQSLACIYGARVPCESKEHLRDCKDIKCPGQFKCPGENGFCLPEGYVCDGEDNCFGGEDEYFCDTKPNHTCRGRFRCRDTNQCISLKKLCDGLPHCDLKDDEAPSICEIQPCPNECSCVRDAVMCTGTPLEQLPDNLSGVKALILVNTDIEGDFEFLDIQQYPKLLRLDLSHNTITGI